MAHTSTPLMTNALTYLPGRNLIKRVPSNQGGKCLAALNHCVVLYMGDKAPSMLNCATGLMTWGTIGNPNTGQFSSRFNTCAHSSLGSSGRFKIFFMENELSDTCCRGCTVGTSSRLVDAMVGMCSGRCSALVWKAAPSVVRSEVLTQYLCIVVQLVLLVSSALGSVKYCSVDFTHCNSVPHITIQGNYLLELTFQDAVLTSILKEQFSLKDVKLNDESLFLLLSLLTSIFLEPSA